jgi:hypothetical protein
VKTPRRRRKSIARLTFNPMTARLGLGLAALGRPGYVASWLRKRAIEPGEISVASKWGYTYTAGWSPSATQHEVKDVDTTQLDGAFAHRVFDDSLLADLPIGVGPCGERGEFHTFVSDSPGYDGPVENMVGETVLRDERFAYGDLIPTTRPQPPAGPP